MPHAPSAERGERLVIHRPGGPASADDFAGDVRRGLTAGRKFLPPKYFYDELGSQLFDAICLLPEYYLTRAEAEVFARHSGEIVGRASAGARVTLFELGSGSATKTRRIVEALLARQSGLKYVPVDISPAALEAGAHALIQDFDGLDVSAYASDYDAALPLLAGELGGGERALVLFLGSNIGNFDREGAREFLERVRRVLRAGDCLLLGADLKKERAVLEDAYDDPLGVTAAFNLNLLARINRELRADFSVRDFRHVALYDEREGRVEMHLESRREQTVNINALGVSVDFREGERIHTENSYKYDLEGLDALAAATGFARAETWLDPAERFSSSLFVAEGG
ncbi:MAG TPA: L-histidine N(alpha)-methyltransferase [Pyrinomonadaceae bacterium]|jgi:dimethylhistidine N-methyltransferase|nr:L-histidine N(alpha)-methyltransferase [Pyrinomonadaceae bacterium]